MPSAEIITIGTEILLGEIVDTNSAYLARRLRELDDAELASLRQVLPLLERILEGSA